MRIVIVNPYPVHRRSVGGVTRLNALVSFLAPRHTVTVLAHASSRVERDAAAVRDLAEIGVEQRLFARPRPRIWTRLSWVTHSAPYCVSCNRNSDLEAFLVALDRHGEVDVVHTEFAYLCPLLGGLGARPVRVLAEQETMSLATDRLRGVPLRTRTFYEHYLRTERAKMRTFEASALRSFDLCYAISSVEAAYMAAVAGRRVEILPHVVCPRRFPSRSHDAEESALLFVGNYTHQPNRHGLLWFVECVWPAVALAVPGARLDVVGPGLDARTRGTLEQRAGIRVRGFVDDLVAHYHATAVFINPIRSGAGMRGKVLEAFACGQAVVSTRMGMEGIAAVPGTHYLQADDPASFARAVCTYLRSPSLRARHGMAARELVERIYDPLVVFPRLEDAYEAAVGARRRCSA